jgi:8-oxo-dGTP pyrophosphatase MutT (NUDIX family)
VERRIDRSALADRLAGFERRQHDLDGNKPAAVAVVVVETARSRGILVTRRASKMRAHAGQWALPGGRLEPGETPEAGSLRELEEELGVRLPPDTALGRLDDYTTRSGYRITPVVVWGGAIRDRMEPNPAEVASVHVATEAAIDVDPIYSSIPESEAPVIQLPILGTRIHAPTAAVIYQFRELALHGRTTRVEHLEQPVFAWR